jgi:hypothetical protein
MGRQEECIGMAIKGICVLTMISTSLLFTFRCFAVAQSSPPKTLMFSGYVWEVRQAGKGGPGPNQWDPKNVWVDGAGRLHLKITRVPIPSNTANPPQTEWRCAELSTKERFGFGRYQFQVTGRIDRLDPNIVLGLFDYPRSDVGKDGTNEIDIEFARWGRPQRDIGNYTIYPASGERDKNATHPFPITLQENAADTTHRFTRESDRVTLQSLIGHREEDGKEIATWVYAPADLRLIPQKPLPVHINLWLFQGRAPSDSKEVEIIIKRFAFTPAH